MSPTLQADLPLAMPITSRRPLVPIEVAVFALDVQGPDDVLRQIESGRIEWSWDIASPGAERREVRIFWRCLTHQMRAFGGSGQIENAVYNEVIPSHWGRVRAASIYRRWACSQELVSKLLAAGCLTGITAAQRGQAGSPEVTRASVIQFLEGRRL